MSPRKEEVLRDVNGWGLHPTNETYLYLSTDEVFLMKKEKNKSRDKK